MASASSVRVGWQGRVFFACAALAIVACAEGAKVDGVLQDGSDDGDGGARGDGGRRNDGGGRGDGGDSGSGDGGDSSPGPDTSSGIGSSGSTASVSASASASSSASSSAQSSVASSASSSAAQSSASSSSSGGGPIECNAPLDPAQDCGNGQHCFPTNQGEQPICSDAGNGGQYGACTDANQCAPIFGCVEVVVGELPCCLQFCTNDFDCPNLEDLCYFFDPPQYAGGVQYGVCYDGFPAGCG